MVLVRENYTACSASQCKQLLFIQHKKLFDAGHVSDPREVNRKQIKSILGMKVNERIFFYSLLLKRVQLKEHFLEEKKK